MSNVEVKTANQPRILPWLDQPVSIAPLAVFRIVFGLLMLGSTIRFWALGWIEDHYIQSKVQFKYYGFEWVQLLPPAGMYTLHVGMLLGALGIMLGYRYRWSALLFFLTFTYTELIDLTYYLNHYYFVSWVSLLLIFLPANRYFSLDARRNPAIHNPLTPRWTILILQFQLAAVYVFAGLAKINYAWLIEAMPLRIWLPANDTLPLIGPLLKWHYTPWLFSWAGMLYDCTIVFWLSYRRTRLWAYTAVIFFHVVTGLMFQIGVFPAVMIGATLIFFPAGWHERVLRVLGHWTLKIFPMFNKELAKDFGQGVLMHETPPPAPPLKGRGDVAPLLAYAVEHVAVYSTSPLPFRGGVGGGVSRAESDAQTLKSIAKWAGGLALLAFLLFHLLFPWRYLLYPGNLFWTEEGYRFSWRVMLMEKAGTATFYVRDGQTGREGVVNNGDFLCAHQEKQMAMQPDMILQFAHFLEQHYAAKGVSKPAVRAEVYVTLNAQPSRLLIDPHADLTKIEDSWKHKDWILHYE